MKKIKVFIIGFFISFSATARENSNWVFFDFGNTIVDTSSVPNRFRYMPGAKRYLDSLVERGYKIGIISNIPLSWGKNYFEKLKIYKRYISDRWHDSKDLDWSYFSMIILPQTVDELKPKSALFKLAQLIANYSGGRAMFQGENAKEVEESIKSGLPAFKIGNGNGEGNIYLKLDLIEAFINKFSN